MLFFGYWDFTGADVVILSTLGLGRGTPRGHLLWGGTLGSVR